MTHTLRWIAIVDADTRPPNGVLVDTKIEDEDGRRLEQPLRREGNLYWNKVGSMYVYYTPTHWRPRP